eukprot:CAMPEP_0198604078 /NCGR_PEP_ID=MMETSP1462-20131121/152738_1 /TAXON_ID=1333877 /ORGANISM="Brandtodinium nutriculum, Strain RCC3387" /LENGTH=44 /DNA_ID= /DNA_START= /DNA_END= /DNA_ORIENTATION=
MANLPALNPEALAVWEDRDRARITLARRAGSTHILACGQAITVA